jgi:transcriptional regulator with XRE-family HTH domain
MSLFSDNIRHLRMKKEVSQEIVAERLSISRDILAKYEQ